MRTVHWLMNAPVIPISSYCFEFLHYILSLSLIFIVTHVYNGDYHLTVKEMHANLHVPGSPCLYGRWIGWEQSINSCIPFLSHTHSPVTISCPVLYIEHREIEKIKQTPPWGQIMHAPFWRCPLQVQNQSGFWTEIRPQYLNNCFIGYSLLHLKNI